MNISKMKWLFNEMIIFLVNLKVFYQNEKYLRREDILFIIYYFTCKSITIKMNQFVTFYSRRTLLA